MVKVSKEKSKHVSTSILLDEENGVDVELIPVSSSQVNAVGCTKDRIYIEYRDCVWAYETKEAKHHFDTIMHKNEIRASVGKYVDAKIKTLPGKKVAVLE